MPGNTKTYKCYECTKMGCELLANKLTGEKGILFTAKYVKRFKDGVDIIDLKTYTSAVSVLNL